MLENLLRNLSRVAKAPSTIIKLMKSVRATRKLTGRYYPLKVRILDSRLRCTFRKAKGARVHIDGTLSIGGWLGHAGFIYISVKQGGTFQLDGDFQLGSGSRISIGRNAKLSIGGRQNESASGITENAIILCQKSITIGKDFLGAWGLFITDSDHHQYGVNNPPMDVVIGDHVWMCPNSTVLKDSVIGRDSVILHGAVVSKTKILEKSLIGGNPGLRVAEAKEWHR